MPTLPTFDHLLPSPADPRLAAIRERIVRVLQSQGEILPSANSPRGRLWHLVNSPNSTLDDCEEVIKLDTALSARILRVANSGAYGRDAENVSQAMLRLGLKFVREQVFNAAVFRQYSGWVLPPEWDLFWLRNIFVARLTENLASAYGPTNGTEYLAGLLHDIGWLFLASYAPEEFTQICTGDRPPAQAERELLPFGHAAVAAAIAARSLVAPRVVEAILQHHDEALPGIELPLQESAGFLAVVLRIADRVADGCTLRIFNPTVATLDEIQQGPEAQWLENFGPMPKLAPLASSELYKSQRLFEAFFSNRQFN
ncbi:MAG: HDOD domain-containing protein [Verrucomicrobiota bacterium]